jgi:hypothetical protein
MNAHSPARPTQGWPSAMLDVTEPRPQRRCRPIVVDPRQRQAYLDAGLWTQDTLVARLRNTSVTEPDRVAVVDQGGQRQVSYADLQRDVNRACHLLAGLGAQPGDVIGVQLPNWYETVVLDLGVLSLGCTLNPMLPIYRSREIGHMLRTAGTLEKHRGAYHLGILEGHTPLQVVSLYLDDAQPWDSLPDWRRRSPVAYCQLTFQCGQGSVGEFAFGGARNSSLRRSAPHNPAGGGRPTVPTATSRTPPPRGARSRLRGNRPRRGTPRYQFSPTIRSAIAGDPDDSRGEFCGACAERLLGVPREDIDVFEKWTGELARGFDPSTAADPTAVAMVDSTLKNLQDYSAELVSARRANPQDDLISTLVKERDGADRLTDGELVAHIVFMLFAGHDTTKSALQMASMLTARFPEQTALIREQPALVSGAVDEVMRFESPVFMTTRQPAMDLQVGGLALAKGQTVGMGLVSAARDRRGMSDADVFDIRRTERRSIGFGAGIHFCLGVNLARAELEEAIRGLATKTSSIELGAEPELIPFRLVRHFKELTLNVTPA